MPAQINDSAFAESLRRLAWDDCKLFLAVHSAGSFKAAARALNLSTNTVRNRIARLEDVVGVRLFERSPHGIAATPAGLHLSGVAKEMASASMRVSGGIAQPEPGSRRVDLHVSEGIGIFWIVPRLVDFHRRHPDIQVRLNCSLTPLERFSESNAVAVQLVRPDDADAVCAHLATLHLMPFASADYIRRRGVPKSLQDARAHQIVLQTGDNIRDNVFPALFGETPPAGLVALETNSSAAHYWAIAKGMGIGMLPTYARAITKGVIPIEMELKLRRDVWLAYPLVAKQSPAVRTVIRWLRESFDHSAYPWFSDAFVHPDAFENEFAGTNVVRLFAGFMDLAETGT